MGGLFQVQEVNPEFLAALPPKIQEEVLAQQRLEQQRCSTAQVEKTTIALKLKFTKSRWTQPPQWTQGRSFKPCLLHCTSPSSPIRRSLKSLPCLQSLRRRLKTCAGITNRYFQPILDFSKQFITLSYFGNFRDFGSSLHHIIVSSETAGK